MPIIGIDIVPKRVSVKMLPYDKSFSIDSRIAHLESAKSSLNKALSAIDELQAEASNNKNELKHLKQSIQQAQQDKKITERHLSELQKLKSVDLSTLRELSTPSRKQVAIERLIGFFIGIVASLIAAAIWSLIK